MSDLTIERGRGATYATDRWTVYEHSGYERGAVLEGQSRRVWLVDFDPLEAGGCGCASPLCHSGGGGGCDPMDSDVTPTAGAAAGELLWGGADGVNPPARWIVDGGDEDDELSAAAVLLSGFVRGGGGGGGGRNSQHQVRMAPLQALKRGNNCRQRAWAAVW